MHTHTPPVTTCQNLYFGLYQEYYLPLSWLNSKGSWLDVAESGSLKPSATSFFLSWQLHLQTIFDSSIVLKYTPVHLSQLLGHIVISISV